MRLAGSQVDDYWPGPMWEPTVYTGIYPVFHRIGDIYINEYGTSPLLYIFTSQSYCEPITPEEVKEWIAAGLMMRPQRRGLTKWDIT